MAKAIFVISAWIICTLAFIVCLAAKFGIKETAISVVFVCAVFSIAGWVIRCTK